jgi:ABC-2 type transport system permease protein
MTSALRYEWRRLITLRATWVLLAFAVGFSVLLAVLQITLAELNTGIDGRAPIDVVLANAHNPISVTLIAAVAAMTFGHEYRHGVIRLTLTALPRRGRLFAAKAIMSAAFAASAYVISLAATALAAFIAGSAHVRFRPLTARNRTSGDADLGVWSSLLWQDFMRAALYVVLFALIAFAITAIMRNLALGIIIPLIASTIFEGLLIGFLESRALWLNDVLPYNNGARFLDWTATGDPVTTSGSSSDPMSIGFSTANPISPIRAGVVFTAWAAMLMASAYVLFDRRDA